MKARLKRLALAALALVSWPLAASAHDDDHVRARDLFEHGEIRALVDILSVVREQAPGDIVAVDLVRSGDRWVYRFQVVAADGRRTTVDVDAQAAKRVDGDDD